MKLITWIVLLVFARSPWQQKADSLINPPLMQQAESILRFDKSTLDIGTLTEDDAPQACRFTGRNISKEAVTVTKVRTTCGCIRCFQHQHRQQAWQYGMYQFPG